MMLARRFFCSLLLAVVVGSAGAADLGTAASRSRRHVVATTQSADNGNESHRRARRRAGRRDHGREEEARSCSWKRPASASWKAARRCRRTAIFRIYSMTKPITGVAMMILFEQGKWQLNDPVSKYIPEFADLKVAKVDPASGAVTTVPSNHPMTMRELMSHSGGLTYGFFGATAVDKQYVENNVFDQTQPMQTFIERLGKTPLLFQPGERWHYSVSVDVQGYLVEKLSGQTFPEFLQQHVFGPLQMVDTAFYVPAAKMNRLAEFYYRGKDGKTVKHPNVADYSKPPVFPSGGGGLVSTASDYMRFCQMLLNGGALDGQRILSPLSVKLMRTNMLPESARTMGAGHGLRSGFRGGRRSGGGRRLRRRRHLLLGRLRRHLVLDRSGLSADRHRHDPGARR